MTKIHKISAQDEGTLRISVDAKATIKLGELSRGGKSRVVIKALDHDFVEATDKIHLLGFYLPEISETYFFVLPNTPHLTADAIVDCLEKLWEDLRPRFPRINRLLINIDNGPESHSRRTQFIKRLVDFVDDAQLKLSLAYYPSYHSKYNPIERVWGVLEQHWNGSLLDSLDTVIEMAKTMTFKGLHPVVNVVNTVYQRGVSLTTKAMNALEQRLNRLKGLAKYFVTIPVADTT